VVAFALWQGAGGLQHADWYLFLAVVLGALGYAEGGKLSRELGGLETISWALVVSLPVLAPVVAWLGLEHAASIAAASPARGWAWPMCRCSRCSSASCSGTPDSQKAAWRA
jgi:hypothetical protein